MDICLKSHYFESGSLQILLFLVCFKGAWGCFKQSHACLFCFTVSVPVSYLNLNVCDVQVACMQFVNIVVHSVENMNFRVHLQHEFTQAGLDDYLEVCCCFVCVSPV